ncbi:MAG: extracellular solute-binding protein [Ruthenibacterium sp.]
MKKLFSILITAALLLASLSGCASKPASSAAAAGSTQKADDAVNLTWAVFYTDNYTEEFWQKIIDTFEADNPGIKIEKVIMTGDSRPQFLKTMLAAGNMPDICLDPGEVAKADGIFAEIPADLIAKYEDATIVKNNGKVNTIPASIQLRSQVYYNKKMFADAGVAVPKTWDEFLQVCETLKSKNVTPLITAGASDIWATSFGYWVNVVNSEAYTKYPNLNQDMLDGKIKWDDDVFVDTVTAWQDMVKAGYYDKGSLSYSYTQASSQFLAGTAAMMMDGSWVAPTVDNDTSIPKDTFGCFPCPVPSGAKTYCASPGYWAVSESCQNKEAAFKFCEYVLGGNKDLYKYFLQQDGLFSVTKTPVTYELGALQQEFMDNYEGYTLVPELTKAQGDVALPSGMEDYLLKSLQTVFAGEDVKATLADCDAQMETLMAAK